VGASVEKRRQLYALVDEKQAGPLRRVHFVPGEGEQVDVFELAGEVNRKLGSGLYGVGVDEDLRAILFGEGFRKARDFADGLNGSGLIVGEHYGDEPGVGCECGFEGCGVDDAAGVRCEVGDFDAAAFERFSGVEHGVVLNLAGDEVRGLLGVEERLQNAGEREVIAFCAAGGEDDFLACAVE